jgi:opacity protein-like surface antigen
VAAEKLKSKHPNTVLTMKKLLLLSASVWLFASAAIAQPVQLQKGRIMTGVTSTMSMCGSWDSQLFGVGITKTKYNYGSTTEETYSSIIFNILPKAGYFFMDNLAGGLELALSGELNKDIDDGDKHRESMIAIGPFVRYYYPLDKLYPFAEAEAMFGSWATGEPGDPDDKEGFFMFGIYLGAAYPLGDKVTFDAMIGYSHARWSWEAYEGEGTEKQLEGGLAIKAGFTVYLR